ncbi:hypothetical protein FORMB_07890 [Formosa sp. Hel1_33_131]|uniref:hypothetical protein n=1 Tax=Formosa sp. Hel1_33_131 TaxID=1336794 RepID=UPI00084E2440|nr:hypothetical protein [Formosa sp. Hel1_33_131]AOR27841.1 hypothetical protein FORMB_07890 [Formosa sp. Hel1_33_131]
MTDEDLNKFIEKVEQNCSESEAYFNSEFNTDFGIAKGNKFGLLLYAKEFLKAAREIDKRKFEQGDMEVYNPDFKWIKGIDSNPFRYIKITKKLLKEINPENQLEKENWKNKLYSIGCGTAVVFALILTFVGLVTFLKWMF